MNRTFATNCVAACLTGVVSLAALVHGQEFEMHRSTIDGGGALRSIGGDFECSGTIGQPDAGPMAGGVFALTGGFWFPLSAGDCDEDGLVGLLDADAFFGCMTGPGGRTELPCRCFDVNASGGVDLRDFAGIQSAYTGG